jgi:uncharacterized protein YcnI
LVSSAGHALAFLATRGARGWSSLAVSVCCGLVFAAAASAHVSVDPSRIETGSLVDLVFDAPNEDDAFGVDHVTIGVPPQFALDDGEAKQGWTQSRTRTSITWSGGRIPKGQFATFELRGTAPARPQTLSFRLLVGDDRGGSTTYRVGVPVVSRLTQDSGARTLGKVALLVALVAIAFALVAGLAALYFWLRPPPTA